MELRHEGPMGEDAAESVGQPRPRDHHCGVQDSRITFGDFRQEWLIFCRGEGGWKAGHKSWGPQTAQAKPAWVPDTQGSTTGSEVHTFLAEMIRPWHWGQEDPGERSRDRAVEKRGDDK